MSKLLIYIGEGVKFDLDQTITAIKGIDGVTDAKSGDLIGAVFECLFADGDVIIRISKDCETITTDGFGPEPLNFIWNLQDKLPMNLWVIDMNYSLNLEVRKFASVDELQNAMASV